MADHKDRPKRTRPFRQDAHHPPILPNQCLYCARWSILLTTANNSRATRAVSNSFVSVAPNHNRQSTMTLVSCWSSLLHPTCWSSTRCDLAHVRKAEPRLNVLHREAVVVPHLASLGHLLHLFRIEVASRIFNELPH